MSARNCPVLTVVSAPRWKHVVTVLLGLSAGLGLMISGYADPHWADGFGPGIARLLRSPASPVMAWANTLLLFAAAQAAWIVWWARSRSLKDFSGSYRIWGWAAATWLFFSFASATQAHLAWSDTVLHYIRWRTPGAALWCWLLPASIWGWGLALRLEQELRDNRAGHWMFLTSGAWYLGTVGLICQREFWPQACAPELTALLLAVLPFLGHASLFLSNIFHARYVLSCTAEPPQSRRRLQPKTTERASLIPSWMRLGWLSRSVAAADDAEEDEDGKPKRGRKRATATKKRGTTRKARGAKAATTEEEWDETSEEWESAEGSADAAGKKFRVDDAEEPAGDHFDGSEDDDSDDSKGLSKRERRKQQQERRAGR